MHNSKIIFVIFTNYTIMWFYQPNKLYNFVYIMIYEPSSMNLLGGLTPKILFFFYQKTHISIINKANIYLSILLKLIFIISNILFAFATIPLMCLDNLSLLSTKTPRFLSAFVSGVLCHLKLPHAQYSHNQGA